MRPVLLWWHELRRAGWPVPAAVVGGIAATLALAAPAIASGTARAQIERLLLTGLEAVVPLGVGMAAVTVVARDPCRELHLTLPTPYLATLGRRLVLVGGVAAAGSLAFSGGLALTGWWSGPSLVASPLVWAPPLLALAGLAMLVAVLGRSVVLATSTVAAVWLLEQLLAGSFVARPWARPFFLFMTTRSGVDEHWIGNRVGLTVTGVVLIAAAVALVRRPEHLLTEEEA
ncbi:MAG: hypothetical protein IRY92_06875 [Dactylosporangium sp.]|nr:hypothetical protein [Dactylosporangium sp.]